MPSFQRDLRRRLAILAAVSVCGCASSGEDGAFATDAAPDRTSSPTDGSAHDAETGSHQVDADTRDVVEPGTDSDAPSDASAEAGDAGGVADAGVGDASLDGSTDAADGGGGDAQSSCDPIGRPCDWHVTDSCPSQFGFLCFGGVADAALPGVCLNGSLGRQECGGQFGSCPAPERCFTPYGFCLYDYEVPCVCTGASASTCSPP